MRPPEQLGGPPLARPTTVTLSFLLMLLRSALSVLGLLITLGSRDTVRARIEEQQQRLGNRSGVDVDQLVDFGIAVGVAFGLVFLVFHVVLAFQVRRGRQWARIVTWVLAGLGVLGLVSQFVVTATAAARIVGVTGGLLDLAVIILLALRPTSDYVTAMTQCRRRH